MQARSAPQREDIKRAGERRPFGLGRLPGGQTRKGERDMLTGPLRLKNSTLGGGIQMAQDYGKQLASKL